MHRGRGGIGSGMVTAGGVFLLSAFAAAFLGASVIRDGSRI
ncbi:hypothetical protein [Actinomadura bangladeshensis]|nr:hypothetical protein [Actinomadura bangladeshensis]